jgi:uncharacterized protein
MDWTVYWFMFPVCIMIASIAMFSGISGAAMLTPIFLIGFPLLGVPRLSTVAAIGTSLFLETSGFGTGLYRYLRMRLVDLKTAKALILLTLPLGALGAIAARHVPAEALRIGYGVAMLALARLLLRDHPGGTAAGGEPAPAVVSESDLSHSPCGYGEEREIQAANGKLYCYCAHGLGLQRVLSGAGAFFAGLISTGVGEATLPGLVQRSRFLVAVAAATSTVIVAGTVAGAATTHLVQLVVEGGLGAIPWTLLVWAVPGAITGAFIGTRLQGRVSERAARFFFAGLFAAIGASFLLAFTIFLRLFG